MSTRSWYHRTSYTNSIIALPHHLILIIKLPKETIDLTYLPLEVVTWSKAYQQNVKNNSSNYNEECLGPLATTCSRWTLNKSVI